MKKTHRAPTPPKPQTTPDSDVEILDADEEELDDADISADGAEDTPVIDVGATDESASYARSLPLPAAGKDSLHLYLREVSRFPLLKPDEEFHLARRVREHDDSEAAFRLISSHLRLVVKIAMDFQRRWMQSVLDLIQEGNVGLMRAVNKFDPDKGIKFSYYAAFWIKAYILKFIMDNWRMVKIGTSQAQRKLFYNLNRERQRLINEGFDPDAELLSSRLGVSKEQVIEMEQRLAAADLSLDAKINDDANSASLMDLLALEPGEDGSVRLNIQGTAGVTAYIEDGLASKEIAAIVRDSIKQILPKLSEKETYILNKRLLSDEPATLREIGERYNITRERVRQLETRLLQKFRPYLPEDINGLS